MKEEIYQLFVYGSLVSGFRHEAYSYISCYFTLIGDAMVRGKVYDLGPYPGALPSNDEHFIKGELYQVNNKHEFSWAIKQLDDYEGMLVEPGETPLFRREPVNVILGSTTAIAWIYWYNQDVTDKPLIQSGDVLAYWQQNK